MIRIVCKKGKNIYALSVSTVIIEDYGATEVYGIQIMGEDRKSEIQDISENYDYVKSLYDLIVEEELCPEHLHDVVEDYLSGCFSKIIPLRSGCEQPYIA